MQNRDVAARMIGLLVFALGIGVLIVSFAFAYDLFTSTPIGAVVPTQPAANTATANLGQTAMSILLKIGALFIMVLAGSYVAARGVQLYSASERVSRLRITDEGNE